MRRLGFLALLALGLTGAAHGAETALGTAVENGNGSGLQVTTGDAVQRTCGQIAPNYNAADNRPATSPEEDLFFRCNEMVQTAVGLNAGVPPAANSLGWNNSELAEAMQQLTGEEQASKGRLATESTAGHFDNVAMRIDAIRMGARANAGGLNLALGGAPVIGGNAGEGAAAGGWGWFVNGAVGFGDRDGTDREDDFDFDSLGATLGADYQFSSGFVLGMAVGYNDFEIDFNSQGSATGSTLTNPVSGGDISIDGYVLTGYAIGDIGRFSIDAVASYGENDYDNKRAVRYTGSDDGSGRGEGLVIDRMMKADTEDSTYAVGTSVGTTFELGERTSLYVVGGINYQKVDIDGYTEVDPAVNGGLNLAYDDQDVKSLQSRLGGQLSRPYSTGFGVVMPYITAEWRHEFENDDDVIVARYAAQESGSTFTLNVRTDSPDRDFFEVGAGVSAVFARNIQGFADYRTILGLSETTSHLFSVGIRGTF